MIFLDSGIFIGAAIENDRFHGKAVEILKELNKCKETILITSFILSEFITAVGRALGGKIAYTAYFDTIDNPKIQLIHPDQGLMNRSMVNYLKYGGTIGLVDMLSVQAMFESSVKKIASFDKDFDKIDGIERVEKL